MSDSVQTLVALLDAVLPEDRPLPLHEPLFTARDEELVADCVRTGWVSSVGAYVDAFEAKLAEFTGAARAIAVVNGTAALHLAFVALGVRSGDEVLLPALNFIAAANAVSYCGAVPHFVDSCPHRLGMDPQALARHLETVAEVRDGACWNRETGRRIAAVVPMHTFGHPVDMDALVAVADTWQLLLIEDAAEALGSFIGERHCGLFGRVGTLSFNGNKIVTTGGGGALLTNDIALADRLKHLSTTARTYNGFAFEHDAVGFNYRLPNINAALGVAQLERLRDSLERKRKLAAAYREGVAGMAGVTFAEEPEGTRSNFWLAAILMANRAERDAALRATNDAGYLTRPAWTLMPDLAMFADCPRAPLPVARDLFNRLVCLPSGPKLMPAP